MVVVNKNHITAVSFVARAVLRCFSQVFLLFFSTSFYILSVALYICVESFFSEYSC